jgi:protein phosphatase
MSPTESSSKDEYLEHPEEAFSFYYSRGIPRVVCQRKHMGSRAVVIACRSEEVAEKRFGVSGEPGAIYTRTGRRFFDDLATERELLARLVAAAEASGFWDKHNTEWFALDCELMPWSAKAKELLVRQYAPVASAGLLSNQKERELLEMAVSDGAIEILSERLNSARESEHALLAFREAYRNYCWQVSSIEDYKIAPFHLLATENAVHFDKDHLWHLKELASLCDQDDAILLNTESLEVDLSDATSRESATLWWVDMANVGGEGMVVKPLDFIGKGAKGLVQPAVKCRGREYLRIIYGPEYTDPRNLNRLRSRRLQRKRNLALKEFALGHEGLVRFAARESLARVHECVFAVLALESEPVDPRL